MSPPPREPRRRGRPASTSAEDAIERGDFVDCSVAQWARVRPGLDVSSAAVLSRVGRIAQLVDQAVAQNLRDRGLTPGDLDVLATLRRAGEPYELSPKQIQRAILRSSGTMTHRIDRLEGSGWVVRRPDPLDRRGVLVRLTGVGIDVIDEAMDAHARHTGGLLAPIRHEDRAELADLLRTLLLALEGRHAPPESRRTRP